jgi:hypothetical protein
MARQTSFTVHTPPPAMGEEEIGTQFVPDRFVFLAFLVPWLYFLWHRLWLETLAWFVAMVAIVVAAFLAGIAPPIAFLICLIVNMLIGFEAVTLRRWKLRRSGYHDAGVVVAANREEAERAWFAERQVAGTIAPPPPVAPAGYSPVPAPQGVIGLFPEPDGGPRGFR